MRRWLGIFAAIVVIVMAYWAWPLFAAAQLAGTARAGDAAGVFDRVDTDLLRRSLSRQIATAYLDVSGKGKKMGTFGRSLAGAAVTTVADPYVAELLTPDNVMTLIARGRVNAVKVGDHSLAVKGELPNFTALLNDHIWSAVTGSYFDQLRDFVIPVDDGRGGGEYYGVHMHLVGLTWKLGGLDLPATIVNEMARSILANEPPRNL